MLNEKLGWVGCEKLTFSHHVYDVEYVKNEVMKSIREKKEKQKGKNRDEKKNQKRAQ